MKPFEPPSELTKADNGSFQYNGITYDPKFLNGEIIWYEGRLKNLRIYIYPNKIYLCNSIHKYWHGNNHGDFTLSDNREAVRSLQESTGISWTDAIVKKCEFGFNIEENANRIINSLISYKGKDFYPMQKNGNKYGAVCEFTDYKIKGYDKALETKLVTGWGLSHPVFRWEIAYNRIRNIEKYLGLDQIRLIDLLTPESWQLMSEDAINKYQNSIKSQPLNLHGLTTHEKSVLAVWQNPQIREDFKIYHRETYKRDKRIYLRLMRENMAFGEDEVVTMLTEKFKELLVAVDKMEKSSCRLVV